MSFSKHLFFYFALFTTSLLLAACSGSDETNLVAVEPPTQLPTAQPSLTPKPTWTPWPTKTPTPIPTPTIDPFATAVTPETELHNLPTPAPLSHNLDRSNPPRLETEGLAVTSRTADVDTTSGNNTDTLFEGLDTTQLTATATEEPTATAEVTATDEATNSPTPQPTTAGTTVAAASPPATPSFIPTNAPGCFNFLQFVSDITIPDGEEIKAGESFVKTWRVTNLGSCYISDSYLFFPLNDIFEVVDTSPLPLIGPDEEGNLSVTLRAPNTTGTYRSSWQLRPSASDEPFGQLYVEIVVVE